MTGWNLALAGASLLLAGTLAWTLKDGLGDRPAPPPPPTADSPPSPDSAAGRVFSLPPLERYSATLARPLFVPQRRPADRQEAPAAKDIRLVGLVGQGGRPRAVLRIGQRSVTAAAGDRLSGWTVLDVLADRVTVDDGTGPRELKLPERSSRPPAPVAGAPVFGAPVLGTPALTRPMAPSIPPTSSTARHPAP